MRFDAELNSHVFANITDMIGTMTEQKRLPMCLPQEERGLPCSRPRLPGKHRDNERWNEEQCGALIKPNSTRRYSRGAMTRLHHARRALLYLRHVAAHDNPKL